MHYLNNIGINVVHRIRKTNNNPIARACGTTIVNQSEEFQETIVVTRAALFEVQKIGDEYFMFIVEYLYLKACIVILQGANKGLLNEDECNS